MLSVISLSCVVRKSKSLLWAILEIVRHGPAKGAGGWLSNRLACLEMPGMFLLEGNE